MTRARGRHVIGIVNAALATFSCRGETAEREAATPIETRAEAPAQTSPPQLPACPSAPTLREMSVVGAPPTKFSYVAKVVGETIAVAAREGATVVRATYDTRTDAWSSLPSFELIGMERGDLPLMTEGESHYLYLIETEAGQAAVVSSWTGEEQPWRVPLQTGADERLSVIAVGRDFVVVPHDACRFTDWSRARRLQSDARVITPVPSDGAPSRRRGGPTEVANGRIVVWGGEAAPASPPADCATAQPIVANGAVLDPSEAEPRWLPLPTGPSGLIEYVEVDGDRWVGFDTGTAGDVALRLLDAKTRSWTDLGPIVRTRVDPPRGLHVVAAAGRVAAFRTMVGDSWGFVVDVESNSRREIGAPWVGNWAAWPKIDEHRLLVIPRESHGGAKEAYVLDMTGEGWCRLSWPVESPFWTEKGSPYYRLADVIDGRLYLWAPEQSPTRDAVAGLVVTIPPA